jgi:hypothetical protein
MRFFYSIPLLSALVMTACNTEIITDEVTAKITSDHDDHHVHASNLDLDLFYEGAIESYSIENCTLSDGTETQCYEMTIAGYPVNHDIGPFCPETTSTTAEDAGIWLDGNAVYDADGDFITSLAEIYDDENWKMYDDEGNVYVTDTQEAFDAAARPDVDPAYQNHCVEGQMEWLENGEPVTSTVLIPIGPIAADSVSSGGNWGITLNGVVIEASAPVDAILSSYTIATFDDCGGHINPFDGYHLHGALGCSEVGTAEEGETPVFAYALDGYPIHSALPADSALLTTLDECNGHETHAQGYHYHANSAEENSVLTCFKGVTVESNERGQGAPGDQDERPEQGNQGGGRPDFAAAAAQLGVTEHALQDALGMPPNFSEAAQVLGVSESDLTNALGGGALPPPE